MPDREETDAIEARLTELKLEHRDLDDVVQRLMQTPVQDQLQLQRLKNANCWSRIRLPSLSGS